MIFRTFTPRANWTLIAGLVSAVLAWLLVWYLLTEPGRQRARAARAEAAATIIRGQAAAGQDAIGVITNQTGREVDSAQRDAKDEAAIRAGSDADAGLRALCLRNDAYRREPACVRLLGADPR